MQQTCHGLSLSLPDTAIDETVYRFLLPEADAPSVPLAAGGSAASPGFTSTVLVSRHAVPAGVDAAEALAGGNRSAAARDATFKLGRSGTARQGDAALVWRDATFNSPAVQRQIFQRQLAWMPAAQVVVIITISSDRPNLEALTAQLGIELADAT